MLVEIPHKFASAQFPKSSIQRSKKQHSKSRNLIYYILSVSLVRTVEIPHKFANPPSETAADVYDTGHFYIRYSTKEGAMQCKRIWGDLVWEPPSSFLYSAWDKFQLKADTC